jgi:hypothetical protein
MLDRQDIDALLMGALYGELSPSESTRLDEHLSAHPQDKLVLDGLTRARQALRDSHVLVLQAEPPAAVSALLLQEAARRAPAAREERVGFFAKLAAMLRHPATAAAAVIVLVAGVAGTLYVQGRGAALQDRAPETTAAGPGPAAEPATTPADPGALALTPSAGSAAAPTRIDEAQGFEGNYRAGLADEETAPPEDKPAKLAKDSATNAELAKNEAAFARDGQGAGAKKEAEAAPAEERKQKKGKGYIEVTTPDPQPKTLDDDGDGGSDTSGLAQAGTPDPNANTKRSPAASTPSAPRGTADNYSAAQTTESLDFDATVGTGAAGGGGAPAAAPEKADKAAAAKPGDARNDQAAKAAHAKLVALVKSNKCNDAAKAAGSLYATYPDYYAEFVADDRKIKACKAYIDSDRKRRNEALKSRSKVTNEVERPAADSSK